MWFSRLRLKGCKFNPAGEISWRNLKCFYISEANLDEALIQNILSGSPLLETLELDHCYGFRRIDITSKSVKKFVFSGYNGGAKRVIEINAPYIVSLTIGDRLVLSKILLLNVTSLVKAELYYGKEGDTETTRKEAEEEMLKGLLVNLSHVKDLKIGVSCQKALSRLEAKGFTLPLDMNYSATVRKMNSAQSNTMVNLYGRVVIADEHSWLQ
ncbi:F-box protein-like protein, partial [Tanacetum coccineum]